jgi:phosphoglycolate phosphatase-like HAD superfamily hydrolase
MKPDAEPVLKVLKELDVKPSEAILIGDGAMDILAARAAGVQSGAVAPGPFTTIDGWRPNQTICWDQ